MALPPEQLSDQVLCWNRASLFYMAELHLFRTAVRNSERCCRRQPICRFLTADQRCQIIYLIKLFHLAAKYSGTAVAFYSSHMRFKRFHSIGNISSYIPVTDENVFHIWFLMICLYPRGVSFVLPVVRKFTVQRNDIRSYSDMIFPKAPEALVNVTPVGNAFIFIGPGLGQLDPAGTG